MKKEVILYGSDSCTYCVKAKEWLKEKDIQFTNKSINIKEEREEFETFNAPGVPLILVKDNENKTEEKIIGFDPESLEKAILK
ncbi:glutaredoxin family protein [Bacillus cereus]|uniref:glutaredoxin family protein n=1 Tax=Bacillus cereus TaxID=1396 RepID=UPI00027C0823|nr:glutaredoxin family protein [Bacillus cereus]EJV54860.1 hypothetical protein IEM_05807 [Bacillus cereus BAG6O-2]